MPPVPAARWPGLVACGSVAIAAFVLGFHKIDDFDTWWHLAAGRWIVANGSVPRVDTLSHTAGAHVWTNVQWGFDVALYALHAAGGPVLLCAAGALTFLAAVLVSLRTAALRAGALSAAVLMLVVVLAAQERVTLRPELASFLLLAAVLFVLDRARRADGRWALALVPLMLIWANMHALFVIGVFAIVCALVGTLTRPSRWLVLGSVAAIAVTLVNPFGFGGVVFPLKLLSRIDGSAAVFQTIGEFGSPFAADATGISIVAYKLLLAVGSVAAAGTIVVSLRANRPKHMRAFDWGGLLFFGGLVFLSAAARRNTAIFAIGAVPFIASCIGILADGFPRWRQRLAKTSRFAALVVAGVAGAVSFSVITGAFYRYDNSPQEFGAGILEGTFPVRAAAFARAADLPANLYNDMASGGYLAWADPLGTGVFVDGRLEVYDTAFLTEYVAARSDAARWDAAADRHGVQTAIIFHRFEPDRALAGRLVQDSRWALVYADEVAAVLVRKTGNDAAIARAAAIGAEWDAQTDAWMSRPAKRTPYPAGRIEGTRAYARFMATAGRADAAIAAYLRLLELGIPAAEEIERRLMLARYFASKGQHPQSQEQARRILDIDPSNADARALLSPVRY